MTTDREVSTVMTCTRLHNYAISALEGDDWALVYAGGSFAEAVEALARLDGEALVVADHGPTSGEISTCIDEFLRASQIAAAMVQEGAELADDEENAPPTVAGTVGYTDEDAGAGSLNSTEAR